MINELLWFLYNQWGRTVKPELLDLNRNTNSGPWGHFDEIRRQAGRAWRQAGRAWLPFTHQVCGPDSGFLRWSRSLWLLLTFLLLSSKRRASCSSKLRPQAATMVTKETTKISWNHQHGCWRLKFRVRVVRNYERENQFLRKHHQSNVPPPLWSHEVRTLVFSCSRKSRSYPEDPGRVFMAGFLWGCVVVKTLLINVSLLHSFTPPAERSSAAIKHTWIWISGSSADHIWPNPAAAPQLGLSGGQRSCFYTSRPKPETACSSLRPQWAGASPMTHQSLEEDDRERFCYSRSNNKRRLKSSSGRNLRPSMGDSSGYTPKSPSQTQTFLHHIIHRSSKNSRRTAARNHWSHGYHGDRRASVRWPHIKGIFGKKVHDIILSKLII